VNAKSYKNDLVVSGTLRWGVVGKPLNIHKLEEVRSSTAVVWEGESPLIPQNRTNPKLSRVVLPDDDEVGAVHRKDGPVVIRS
jgi:hypothetical protein